MEPEPALPIVSFVDDKKSKQKIQKILDKRQKKRKADNSAYRVENKAPVGVSGAKPGLKLSKSSETPTKKRKLSEESADEDNFETMMPDSSDDEDGENQSSNSDDADSDDAEAQETKKSNVKPVKDTKARLSGALSALLAGADGMDVSAQSASAESADSDVDEEAIDAAPILSEVRKTSAQRRAEKKAAKEAQRVQSELRLQRKLLKNKDHVELDAVTNEVDKEVRLRKIGTKGVVKLFNAIRTSQKLDQVESTSSKSSKKKKEQGENMSKEKFLEILQRDRNISADDAQKMLKGEAPAAAPVSSQVKSDTAQSSSSGSSWKVLRDDYLLGARMKDWDKEHSDDEVEREVENNDEMEDDEDESE